jgi:Ca2+-binding EF-hand superfamily protein
MGVAGGACSPEVVANAFKRLDKDGDGAISQAEAEYTDTILRAEAMALHETRRAQQSEF